MDEETYLWFQQNFEMAFQNFFTTKQFQILNVSFN